MDAEFTIPTGPREGMGAQTTGRAGPGRAGALAAAALHLTSICTLCMLFRARHLPALPPDTRVAIVFVPTSTPAPGRSQVLVQQNLASSTLSSQTDLAPVTLAPIPPRLLPPTKLPSLSRPAQPARRNPIRAAPMLASPRDVAPSAPASLPDAALRLQSARITPVSPQIDIGRAMALWEARIRQAVQDAAIYPPPARLLRREGSAQVRFDYDRGAVKRASIAQTSRVGALDNAALAAVNHAAIPTPPAELGPQKRTMLVWVRFRLASQD